jgi:hypothetical protein
VSSDGGGLADTARTILDDILKAKSKEIASIIKQYAGETDLQSKQIAQPPRTQRTNMRAVSSKAIEASKSFANELARLKADYDPGWNRKVSQGKLNVQAYGAGADIEECFDEWDMGREDAVDIECVILLDVSPSMGDNIDSAYESMWAMKRALDKVGASTSVVAFSHEAHMLYTADERAGTTMKHAGLGGGTAPLESLKYAKYLLANSSRAVKIAISITDGAWSETDECDKLLRELRRGGVITALAFVESSGGWWGGGSVIDSHGCEVAVNVTDTSDLFTLGKHMVKTGVARNLAN